MNKPISPRTHGMIDYATVLAVAAAPRVLDMPDNAAILCHALAGGYFALSMVTDYPLSAAPMVPFKAHGAAEAAIGLALPAMPWALGFNDHRGATGFFFALTAFTAVVASLTDWEADTSARKAPRIRKVA